MKETTLKRIGGLTVVGVLLIASALLLPFASPIIMQVETTVTAASGSPTDIQAAVDLVAASGGTVMVPSGDFLFDTFTGSYEGHTVGVWVPGGVNIMGAGKAYTLLRQTQVHFKSFMFYIDGINGKPVRISGITFKGFVQYDPLISDESVVDCSGVHLLRTIDFRVDHCHFEDFCSSGVSVTNRVAPIGVSRGVIDHCTFDNPYKEIYEPINSANCKWGYGVQVNGDRVTWDSHEPLLGATLDWNSCNNVVFIEDCTFSRCRHSIASNDGAWYVSRHNTIEKPRPRQYGSFDVHGNPGGRGLESYLNTFTGERRAYWDATPGVLCSVAHLIRGGDGVIWGNTGSEELYFAWLQMELADTAINDLWIWDNTVNVECNVITVSGPYVEGVEYHASERPGYIPYVYPHPLVSGEPPLPTTYLHPLFTSAAQTNNTVLKNEWKPHLVQEAYVTQSQVTVNSVTYAAKTLSVSLDGEGTQTLLVYCGSMGAPNLMSMFPANAITKLYSSYSTCLQLTVTFASPVSFTLEWYEETATTIDTPAPPDSSTLSPTEQVSVTPAVIQILMISVGGVLIYVDKRKNKAN